MSGPSHALVMKKCWAEQILCHGKVIELRGCSTTRRGKIAIASGGLLMGEVEVNDCFLVAAKNKAGELEDCYPYSLKNMTHLHQVEDFSILKGYKKVFAWALRNPTLYEVAKPYSHPRGAVIWVNLRPGPKKAADKSMKPKKISKSSKK